MPECQEKDDLITSEGIGTLQGVPVETGPFKEYVVWGGYYTPHRHDGYEWRDAMSSGFVGIVSELKTGENHKTLAGILWGRLKRAHHNR